MPDQAENLIDFTTAIVTAHVSKNNVALSELPRLIQSVHAALAGLDQEATAPAEPEGFKRHEPKVGIKASIKPDYLVCMVCGAKQKTLKRHLAAAHQMTPQQYREEFGLKPEYPMTASVYSEHRRGMAHRIGLGRKPARVEAGATEDESDASTDAATGAAPASTQGRRKLTIAV